MNEEIKETEEFGQDWEWFEEESGFSCWEDVMADYCGE